MRTTYLKFEPDNRHHLSSRLRLAVGTLIVVLAPSLPLLAAPAVSQEAVVAAGSAEAAARASSQSAAADRKARAAYDELVAALEQRAVNEALTARIKAMVEPIEAQAAAGIELTLALAGQQWPLALEPGQAAALAEQAAAVAAQHPVVHLDSASVRALAEQAAIAGQHSAIYLDPASITAFAEQAAIAGGRQIAGGSREQSAYARAKSLLDRSRWADAIEAFDNVAKMKGQKADGALYWKAYAQNRLGQRAEALATLQELQKAYPKSAWLNDAKALELDVRQAAGQVVSPESETDDDLKLMALNVLMQREPERSIPMLEKVLQGDNPPRVKSRALFVLAQSKSPQSREILARVAKGGMNPDLQAEAVRYLGIAGGAEDRQVLSDLYTAASDVEVKRQILRSFTLARDRERLLAAAKTEKSPELRAEAVRQLGLLQGSQDDLYELYRSDQSPEVRSQIISSMMVTRSADRLLDIARTEKDPKLRAQAIRNLVVAGGTRRLVSVAAGQPAVAGKPTGAAVVSSKPGVEQAVDAETAARIGQELVNIYKSEKDKDVRKAVVHALYVQGNAKALVDIARSETDPEMKKDIVQRLSNMKSKEATDYLMELLVK